MKMTGAQAVMECLRREGVEVVFGYPGGAVLSLYDEVYKQKFPHILTGHEQGAVHAADGYARVTGKPGVCFATSGPGVCNMVTGLATANMDSIPLVVISGQVASHLIGRDSFQEADTCAVTKPITKRNILVTRAKDLPRVMKKAFSIAQEGRPGPVLVDIAKDVFDTSFDFAYPGAEEGSCRESRGTGEDADVARAAEAAGKAERPLLLVGGGVILSDMSECLNRLAEATHIPVVTTLMGKGAVPDTGGTHLGMVGMHGSYAANKAVMNCDLLLCIGARFDDRVTGDVRSFAPHARIVHFDIDKKEISKIIHADIGVQGDLRWSLPLFEKELAARGLLQEDRYAAWRDTVLGWKAAHPFRSRSLPDAITPQGLFEEVQKWTDADTIVATDVGQHQMWAAQFFHTEKPRHFITSGGLGTMGYGLPAAMGAKIGAPHSKVVLFTGDGSLLMNCQEFATLHKYGVDVKTVVLCNRVLGMVNQWQRLFYDGHYAESVLEDGPDLAAVSSSMGVPGFSVQKPEDLPAAVKRLFETEGPALLNVRIPEDEDVYPMVPGGKSLDDMLLGPEAQPAGM